MNLTEEQIVQNWEDLMEVINKKFQGERRQKLLAMYEGFQERMMLAPASGIEHFHNCFAGGYVDHVLRVISCTERLYQQWEEMEADMSGYTIEELMFCALNHDLGKVGDIDNEYYVPNPSEWHRKNQGKLYKFNPELDYMSVPDRSLFLLAQNGVSYTYNEAMGIRLHDGLYDDSNAQYLKTFNTDKEIKSNLPTILHHADHMASRIEHDNYVKTSGNNLKPTQKRRKATPKLNGASSSANDLFKDFFKED